MIEVSQQNLPQAIQARAARAAVSPSATRNQGGKGVVRTGREFLSKLDLSRFGVEGCFKEELKHQTRKLQTKLPGGTWGLARKLLNIFLRDALYTSYLREAYGLDRVEHLLEIPLDSYTAKELRNLSIPHKNALPPWKGVKHLKEEHGAQYQAYAADYALKKKVARVHLDAFWWGARAEGNR